MLILTINKLLKLNIAKKGRRDLFHVKHGCCSDGCVISVVSSFSLPLTTSSSEEDEEGQSDVAPCCEVRPPASAHQRRRRGENGAALIFRHQNVTDVPLTAG